MKGVLRMKKLYQWIILTLSLTAIVLECLPNGVEMHFMAAPYEDVPYYVTMASYYSLLPFGYANFAPLLTFICTVLLVLCAVFWLIRNTQKTKICVLSVSWIATVLSVIASVFSYGTAISIGIVALLVASALLTTCVRRNIG